MEQFLSLPVLVFSPLIAILILFIPIFSGKGILIRRFAKGFASLHFLYSLCFLAYFDTSMNEGIAYAQNIKFFGVNWIDILGIKFCFGLDGLSLLMVLLTSFIFLLAIVASKNNITTKPKFYYSLVFFLQMCVLGVFSAQDLFLFFMFWELELVPMYFLISQWGHNDCKKSAMKFVLFTFIGSLFMLLGILLLHFYNFAAYDHLTASFADISVDDSKFPMFLQIVISILLLIGFAVKMPIVPLHTWLPNAHTDAPTPISMILASILLKMGVYGIIRFNMQLLPEAFVKIAPFLLIFALINIIYAGLVAYSQTNLKKLIAYSSISNMGIVLLGLCTINVFGLSGAIFHALSHGFIAAALFMVAGVIYLRTKTYELKELGGLGHVMPRLMGFALIIGLASVGIPLLISFVGEFLVFYGVLTNAFINSDNILVLFFAILAFAVLIISLTYILKLLHKTFFSDIYERWSINGGIADISNHEFIVLSSLSIAIILFGIYPMGILNIIQPVADSLLQLMQI